MILDDIFKKTKQELEVLKTKTTFDELLEIAKNNPSKRALQYGFKDSLLSDNNITKIIAEVKKASPSKGIIRQDFDYLQIAKEYESNNASCISVLTEPYFFQGSLGYLEQIAQNINLPLLRKDFIFDKYQILQAYISGASAILLIAKMLEKHKAKELFLYAKSLGLDVLFEVHNKQELEVAFFCDADIIGINHRNLEDFSINLELCDELVPIIRGSKNGAGIVIVAESAIEDKQTINRLSKIGVNAFLIGEFFMREQDVGAKLKDFTQD